MAQLYSFTDRNGKRGVIGSYVYPATLDEDPETDDKRRALHAKKVVKIIREGRTFLKFEDSPGMLSYAKNYVIIKMEG